ncbi:MAG TPA: hypothetical protein VH593_02595 [Ktedonobacteraceae bacterium]|jgi:hypothetical protein
MERHAKLKLAVAIILAILLLGAGGAGSAALAGGNGFSISLTSTAQYTLLGQYVTITATTNADVGPTPYYISVYDQTSQTELAICGTGTICSATVAQSSIGTHSYQAYVGDYPALNSPPGFVLVASSVVSVSWWYIIRPFPLSVTRSS